MGRRYREHRARAEFDTFGPDETLESFTRRRCEPSGIQQLVRRRSVVPPSSTTGDEGVIQGVFCKPPQ
jgi:hypothetical protein